MFFNIGGGYNFLYDRFENATERSKKPDNFIGQPVILAGWARILITQKKKKRFVLISSAREQ